MSDRPPATARLSLRITGRVQGVGFRYSACAEARRLGVTGWVRNTTDGAVEIMAEGDADRLRRLLAWSQQGPRGADVAAVEAEWLPYRGELAGFHIRH